MNICVKCGHHRGPGREAFWYDHFCGHPDLVREKTVDPVTGAPCYFIKNDLGRTVTTDCRLPYCRDINNDGECAFFAKGKR